MKFMRPDQIKSDKFKWCKKLSQMTCGILCNHRKNQKSKNPDYNRNFSECIDCKVGE